MSSKVNHGCMASSQSKFVLSNLPIVVNLFKYREVLYLLCKSKKVLHSSFYEDEQFLDSGVSAYFTLFESNFVDMILDNYG